MTNLEISMNPKHTHQKQRLAVVFGSNREERLCDSVGQWALAQVAAHGGYEVDLIDPATTSLPPRLGNDDDPALREFQRRIDRADAYLIVTPEYNHGYPAALKLLIDSAKDEWKRKPAAFVSYGGQSGGLRAVEQLRLVFAELHVVTMRDSVSFVNAWESFGDGVELRDPQQAAGAMSYMLDHLQWWSETLSAARIRREEPAMA
jgi:NAD(P)H-dependent FMN reductase